jgi:hypothetical protein
MATLHGLDVHKRFIQVCEVGAEGQRREDYCLTASAEGIQAFTRKLGSDDQAVLEATFHSGVIWSWVI